MGSCFDKHAKCWANSELGQGKVYWRTQSFCRQTQNGESWGSKLNDYLHPRSTRTQSWCYNQSNFIFVELERTHIPHGQLFQQQINPWRSSLRSTKQACFFSHDCLHFISLRRSQGANFVFDNMPASALKQGGHFRKWCFVRQENPDFNLAGGDSLRQNRLAHIRPKQQSFSFPAWWCKSWSLQANRRWSAIWSRIINRTWRTSRLLPCVSHRDSETHARQNGNLERREVSKIEDRVRCQICSNYQRPGETCCTFGGMHATRNYRDGQEAGRATHQQSFHHVRPWNSQIGIEEFSNASMLWKLCWITKTQGSERLLGFRGKA